MIIYKIQKDVCIYIILLLLSVVPNISMAETVGLFYDFSIPQHIFAGNDIKNALESRGYTVEVKNLNSLDVSYRNKKIVISIIGNPIPKSIMKKQGGNKVPGLSPQSYALRTTLSPHSYWIFGGDNNGAMYGALQIAENINFDGLKESYNEEEKPFLKNRGIKFNIPLDKESPTYFYSNDGTSNKLAIKDVWDINFWKIWFDEMARNRYNVLSLWSPHPFTSMLDMEDEYPGIAINGVVGYDNNGNEVQVNNMSIEEKIEFWREVMKYGKNRGFDIYFCTWNIFLSTAEGKHGLTFDSNNIKTKEYLKKCMFKFLETYPDLKGFGITVGERMSCLDNEGKEEWAWDTYGSAMMEYAKANPQRNLVFIHRQHDGNINHILKYFSKLNKLPNVRFDLSCKYSEAHAHSTIKPSRWYDTNMEHGLDKYGIMSWLTIRNDDFYFLHWAEPKFVRDYIKGFPTVDKYVNGFYIGADGWVFTKEFTSKNPYYKKINALSIQRTWYMQKLWGRIAYNPDITDGFFKKHLFLRFPEISSDKLFDAWSSASCSVRKANEQVTGKWRFDNDFWIEMWTGDTWGGGRNRHFTVKDTKEATPSAGSRICSLFDTARGKCGDRIEAWENAEQIERLAMHSLNILDSLDFGSNVELSLTLKDIKAQAYLGLYSAYKFRTVMYDIQNNKEEAADAMAKAYCFWRNYTDIMDELYFPVMMQRNKSFSSWHDYDSDVFLDYMNLVK